MHQILWHQSRLLSFEVSLADGSIEEEVILQSKTLIKRVLAENNLVEVIPYRQIGLLSDLVHDSVGVYGGADKDTTLFKPVCDVSEESS